MAGHRDARPGKACPGYARRGFFHERETERARFINMACRRVERLRGVRHGNAWLYFDHQGEAVRRWVTPGEPTRSDARRGEVFTPEEFGMDLDDIFALKKESFGHLVEIFNETGQGENVNTQTQTQLEVCAQMHAACCREIELRLARDKD